MKHLSSVFKALSDRNRLRIVAALTDYNELCACQIIELINVTGATASRHMGVLISADLVESRKEGRWVYYRLSEFKQPFTSVLDWMRGEFARSSDFQNDRQRLERIIACQPEELCRMQRGEIARHPSLYASKIVEMSR